jgi:hypothetical protein
MKYPALFSISKEIELQLFSQEHELIFYESIHKIQSEDKYRVNLQCRFPKTENVLLMLKDAIENKFVKEGSPDYFIYYDGELAGMFEFHTLNSADHVEI